MTTDQQQIGNTLTKWQPSLEEYAVSDYNKQAFIKSAMLAIAQDSNLQECFKTEQGKASLFQAMRYAATNGLSLNPQEGKAAIIAYKGNATYQVMKNGFVELAHRSGAVKFISSDTVRENDEFEVEKTEAGDTYRFKPARRNRGGIDGVFASFVLKEGTCKIKYIAIEEIKSIRDQYSSFYKNKPSASPWSHSFEGMALKTVIKALLRGETISPELVAAVTSDDESEGRVLTKDITDSVNKEKGTSPDDLAEKLKPKSQEEPAENDEERIDF